MLRFVFALLLCVFGGFSQAFAAKTNLFQIYAQLPSGGQLNGTIMVDRVSGTIIGAHVVLQGDPGDNSQPEVLTRVVRQYSNGIAYIVELAPDGMRAPVFIFGERTSPLSMAGYEGGPLGPRTDVYFGPGNYEHVQSGYMRLLPGNAG